MTFKKFESDLRQMREVVDTFYEHGYVYLNQVDRENTVDIVPDNSFRPYLRRLARSERRAFICVERKEYVSWDGTRKVRHEIEIPRAQKYAPLMTFWMMVGKEWWRARESNVIWKMQSRKFRAHASTKASEKLVADWLSLFRCNSTFREILKLNPVTEGGN